MYRKFKKSLDIFKSCFSVFKSNKKLLIFPLFNLLPGLIIFSFFLIPLWETLPVTVITGANGNWSLVPNWNNFFQRLAEILSNITMVGYIAIYLLMMFVATFINVAFYSELLKAINGQHVFIFRGFKVATKKMKAILLWSLLSGLVGVVIRLLEEQFDFIGRWIMRLIGFAWSTVTVFAIPVLIREENQSNPLNYLKYSAKLIKRTWGEGVIGFIAITMFSWLLILAIFITPIVLGFGIAAVGFKLGLWVVVIGLLIAPFLIFAVIYLQSLMAHIFRCTLYVYASEGVVPTSFTEDLLIDSFKHKK